MGTMGHRERTNASETCHVLAGNLGQISWHQMTWFPTWKIQLMTFYLPHRVTVRKNCESVCLSAPYYVKHWINTEWPRHEEAGTKRCSGEEGRACSLATGTKYKVKVRSPCMWAIKIKELARCGTTVSCKTLVASPTTFQFHDIWFFTKTTNPPSLPEWHPSVTSRQRDDWEASVPFSSFLCQGHGNYSLIRSSRNPSLTCPITEGSPYMGAETELLPTGVWLPRTSSRSLEIPSGHSATIEFNTGICSHCAPPFPIRLWVRPQF
jgi:hypothetical protein